MIRFILFVLTITYTMLSIAETSIDYQLNPVMIAKDTYVLIGKKEDFTRRNGGNIVNTGFIITEQGVIVIDTGPSMAYGMQMRTAIQKITDKPVIKVFLTHHHPDHIFGNQAYNDVPIYALPETIDLIKNHSADYLNNLYKLIGKWMEQTEVMMDILPLTKTSEDFVDHKIRYISFSGHTNGDLAIMDQTTGVIFTGDLVFHNRALTTSNATPQKWLDSLHSMNSIKFLTIVPGHGEIANNNTPIDQTIDYLNWLEATISAAVNEGKEMNETLETNIPKRFKSLSVVQNEFIRSVSHRYPIHENFIFNK